MTCLFELAKRIVNLIDSIRMPKSSYLVDQLARTGTSIGANINEAQYAHSKADFIENVSVQYPVISRRFIAEKSVLSTQKGTDFSLRSK